MKSIEVSVTFLDKMYLKKSTKNLNLTGENFDYNLKMKMSTSNTYLKVGVSINPTSSFISNLTYVANKTFTTSLNFDNGTCGFSFIDYLRNEIDPNCKISKKK